VLPTCCSFAIDLPAFSLARALAPAVMPAVDARRLLHFLGREQIEMPPPLPARYIAHS
jgi:hypothetical protein